MQRVEWSAELEIGINVIDSQHRRIVDYINDLVDAGEQMSREKLAELINALVDYTYSHFAFEEALMEEAGYEFLSVHQRTHEAFIERLAKLHDRFKTGEDISAEIGGLLQAWLINHIMEDDQSYAPMVRQMLPAIESRDSGHWMKSAIRRFFS